MSEELRYHHIGIPSDSPREGEKYLEAVKVHLTDSGANPYGIEWLRFEAGSPMPELIQTVPHVGFAVDDISAAIAGKNVIVPPTSPLEGLTIAFIEHDGAPVEFLEFSEG